MSIHRAGVPVPPRGGGMIGGDEPQRIALAALERLAVSPNREVAHLALGPVIVIASGDGPQTEAAITILGRLTTSPHREIADEANQTLDNLVLGGGPHADLAQEVLHGRRLSGLPLEGEVEILRRVQAGLRPSNVDVPLILRPPADVGQLLQPYVPQENLADPAAWDAYRRKLDGIIGALPAAAFGQEEHEQADNRAAMRRALILGGQGGAYPDSWFAKTMATGEARSRGGQMAVRTMVATAINCLQALQQRGCQREVFDILHGLLFYADACPDRSSFGVNHLDVMTRLYSRLAGERDGDKKALLLLEELVQQAKFNFMRTELTSTYGNAGEGLEGYLFQCLRLKDVLGLGMTMARMLYAGVGRPLVTGDFESDLRRVLNRLSSEDDFLAFVTTPPEDSMLSSIPRWEQVTIAPARELANCTSEADRSRLLISITRPMLQALGVIKAPPIPVLQEQARAGDLEAIEVIYWQGLAGQEPASLFLRQLPCTVRDLGALGLLAKCGNTEAQRLLTERCDHIQQELGQITDPMSPRREELVGEAAQIGRYGIAAAIRVLTVAKAANELWGLAKLGNGNARAAFSELVASRDPDTVALLQVARREGDPLAAEIRG